MNCINSTRRAWRWWRSAWQVKTTSTYVIGNIEVRKYRSRVKRNGGITLVITNSLKTIFFVTSETVVSKHTECTMYKLTLNTGPSNITENIFPTKCITSSRPIGELNNIGGGELCDVPDWRCIRKGHYDFTVIFNFAINCHIQIANTLTRYMGVSTNQL